MPYIDVKTNAKLQDKQIEDIKAELGKAITVFPGKSETWLMCGLSQVDNMFFQGNGDVCAFVEVKLFGSVDESASSDFTRIICDVLAEHGIPASRVYVRYEGGTQWGWNNGNF